MIALKKYNNLLGRISGILAEARRKVVTQINRTQVLAYWEIGKEIVEFEQKSEIRAEYGQELIVKLSEDMMERFGKGFSKSNLFLMRQFYLSCPEKFQTLSGKSKTLPRKSAIQQTVCAELWPMLSWSCYCELLKVEEPLARSFYEQEAVQRA